jgi:type IV fimbrial biogenesis protein FimT
MTRPHTARSGGFTIIELMVTIAVVSVLLSLAVPAFNDLMRRTRIANQTNAIVGALNYARGETATRGLPITVCAAADMAREECLAASEDATDWTNGFIVFTDRTGDFGEIDGTDQVLQAGGMPEGGFTLASTATFARFAVGASPSTERTFTVRPTDMGVCVATGTREITIGRTGRVMSTKKTCP